jgi:MFS family permease
MVSNTGSWMETVAVGTLIKSSTGKDTLVAVAAVASFLPVGVLSPVGGALADRVDRKTFIIATNCFEALVAAALAVAAARGDVTVPLLTGLVFLQGCSAALRLPFQQAILPDLVPPEDLLGAVALGSTQYNVGRVLGPAAAAVIIARWSVAAAFAVNAVSFVAVVIALSLIHIPRPVVEGEHGVVRRILEGARAAKEEPGCRAALLLMALVSFTVAPFIALVAGRAGALVDGGVKSVARATGALTTAQGIGAVVGALLVPTLAARFGRRAVSRHRVRVGTVGRARGRGHGRAGRCVHRRALRAAGGRAAPCAHRLPGSDPVAVLRRPRHALPDRRALAGRAR